MGITVVKVVQVIGQAEAAEEQVLQEVIAHLHLQVELAVAVESIL
jgi:hypothetical protein